MVTRVGRGIIDNPAAWELGNLDAAFLEYLTLYCCLCYFGLGFLLDLKIDPTPTAVNKHGYGPQSLDFLPF